MTLLVPSLVAASTVRRAPAAVADDLLAARRSEVHGSTRAQSAARRGGRRVLVRVY